MPGSSGNYAKQALNHSLREPMIREMHARPFLKLKAPCRLAFIALKPEEDDGHTPEAARRQLIAFLDRFDAEHPHEGAVFHVVKLGDMTLKWENHSEFATYTLFTYAPKPEGLSPHSFATDLHAHFTMDWLKAYPGRIISSVSVRIEQARTQKVLEALMSSVVPDWFGSPTTSFAAAYVIDRSAAIAADFDLDHNGQIRLAVLACDTIGPGRIGRVVQRFLEIETYRAMSMLTLPAARAVMKDLRRINAELSETVEQMGDADETDKHALDALLRISAELSLLSSRSSFRFSAASAYEAIVLHRIDLLREERILGRQLVSEFMKRRYAPSMRTCESANSLLEDLTERAADAVELLGTRVSVTTAEQNRQLLSKMDARAAQQARLQETVEGISVVAITYYTVSLLSYLLSPLSKVMPVSKTMISAFLVVPVAAFVWISMHRLKEKLIRKPDKDRP
ncbi:DUF3422 domain-containing protein [uncultured Cohaesibacter sp.]|uniref:DUF3422 domain-containing protein n=1 Tax=uncultured Cohaesibacter sp. TaxID=1002546 RepID=UPI0029C8EC16|nr:DUF3422 domain-containing protein [uncultured Cohaesibacter sp.]